MKLYFINKTNTLKNSTSYKDSLVFSLRLWIAYELTIPFITVSYAILEVRYGMSTLFTLLEIIIGALVIPYIIITYFYFFFVLLFNSFKTNKWKSFLGFCVFLVGVAYFAFMRSIGMAGIFGF